jgi:hypothetical protein
MLGTPASLAHRVDPQVYTTGMGLGRLLITAGVILVIAGILVTLLPLGRLPGDIRIQGKNSTFYFPLATCLLVSVVLSVVMWALKR